MSTARSSSRRWGRNITSTKSNGPHNRNFLQNLISGGVYPDGYRHPDGQVPTKPDNWEEINRRLTLPRRSLSPSKFTQTDYEKFTQVNKHAVTEKQVITSVISIIGGNIGDSECVSSGIPFTNLEYLTDDIIMPGNPDIYYGAHPEQLNRRVRDELSEHIIPSIQDDLPIVPNFFLAARRPNGSLSVAEKQATYNGALGARAMLSLQSYGRDEPVFDNKAYTITSIYHNGTLKLYTVHCTQPANPEGRPASYTHEAGTFAITYSRESFQQGATAYRNLRDWTKEQRDEAIARANERAGDSQATPLAVDASFGQVYSFTNKPTSDEKTTMMTEVPSQESRTLLTETSRITSHLQNRETSSVELSINNSILAKRSNTHSEQSPPNQRKRRKVGE